MNTIKCTNAESLKRTEGARGEQLQLIESFRLQQTLGIILTPNYVCLTGDSEPVPPSSSLPGLSSFISFLYGLAIQCVLKATFCVFNPPQQRLHLLATHYPFRGILAVYFKHGSFL